MGQRVGDSEAGLTVLLLDCAVMRMPSMREEVTVVCDAIWPSWELNSSCENVMGFGLRASNEGDEPDEPSFWRSSSMMWWALSSLSTSSWFFFSRASTSWRLRSRDDCAARRLRRTRSTLRCSFSSSVLARFLEGGRSAVVRRDEARPRFLPWREVCLGFWEDLAPRLPLLRLLLLACARFWRRGRRVSVTT